MNGCQTCGGFGMRHDPVAHNWAPAWATCPTCKGEQTVRDDNDLDVTCPECGHGPERHGPEAGGCIECRCTDLLADFAESMDQMRRGEGVVIACPHCDATYDGPGHRPECPRYPRRGARMNLHPCPRCDCTPDDAHPPQGSTSSPGIRRAVIEQTRAEVRRAKEQRTAKADPC